MKKDNKENKTLHSEMAKEIVFGNEKKIYSHAVFCQCILPVRALPEGETYYQVEHGNTSLIIQSGIIRSESGQVHKMEVPAGPKARLLFPYIIDQAKRTGNPTVDMGVNLHQFMLRNKIPVAGSNAKEITRQVQNIAASNIHLGVWTETETHKFSRQKNYRVASEISFWTEKNPEQLSIWSPQLTISDEFMAAIEKHTVLINLQPLIELQANPRAMDIYTWLNYRIQTVKRPVKISYRDLHSVFGQQTKELFNFKTELKRAIRQALPFITQANVDLNSDKNHIILRNTTSHHFYMPGEIKQEVSASIPVTEGVFGALKDLGLSVPAIEKIAKQYEPAAIEKAVKVTKQRLEVGKVDYPPGFLTTALKEGWEPKSENISNVSKEDDRRLKYDAESEAKIKPVIWRKVRKELYAVLGEAIFNSWVAPLEFVSFEKGRGVLKTSNRFIAQTVEDKYLPELLAAWQQASGEEVTVSIVVEKEPALT